MTATAAAVTATNFSLMLIHFCGCTQERDQCDPARLSDPCPLAAFTVRCYGSASAGAVAVWMASQLQDGSAAGLGRMARYRGVPGVTAVGYCWAKAASESCLTALHSGPSTGGARGAVP